MNLLSAQIDQRVYDAFSVFQIKNLKNRSIFNLSSGEKQKIALASTYAMRPGIYVLDEPSANLDIYATKMLGKLLKTLKEQGATIIVSEHRLYYLMALADRVIYMRDGEVVQEWTPEQTLELPECDLVEKGLRAFDLDMLTLPDHRFLPPSAQMPAFAAKNISINLSGHALLQGINFSIAPEDNQGIIGITGANGVGKTTLAKCLCGLLKRQHGSIEVDNRLLSIRQRAREMYFVMQDTDYQLFTESVEDELRLGNQKVPELEAKITDALALLGLLEYREIHPMALSGGQNKGL